MEHVAVWSDEQKKQIPADGANGWEIFSVRAVKKITEYGAVRAGCDCVMIQFEEHCWGEQGKVDRCRSRIPTAGDGYWVPGRLNTVQRTDGPEATG